MLKFDVSKTCRSGGGTEDILWSTYLETRSTSARNRLVLFYAPLVKYEAERVARTIGVHHPAEDLYQMGVVGLIDAVGRFDRSDGYKFSTYATYRIRGAVMDGLRRADFLPKRRRAEVNEYQAARDGLVELMHRTPNIAETASRLARPVNDVASLAAMASRGSVMTALSLLDMDAAPELLDFSLDPARVVEKSWTRESVKDALAALTERQRSALVLHHLEGFSKSEVAEMLGVDRSRVTQLLCRGTLNLRNQLKGSGVDCG